VVPDLLFFLTLGAELSDIQNKAPKLLRPLREYCCDGHSIAVKVTKFIWKWTEMGQNVTLFPFFAVHKWQKRYVIAF
jgi:hypothetical protein